MHRRRQCRNYDVFGRCIQTEVDFREEPRGARHQGHSSNRPFRPHPSRPRPPPAAPSRPVPSDPSHHDDDGSADYIGNTPTRRRFPIKSDLDDSATHEMTPEEIMEAHIVQAAYENDLHGTNAAQDYLNDHNVPYDIDPEISNRQGKGKTISMKRREGAPGEGPEHYVASRGLDIGNVDNLKDIYDMAKGDRGTRNYKKAKRVYDNTRGKYGVEASDVKLVGHSEGGGHSSQIARETGSDATIFNGYVTPDHSIDNIKSAMSNAARGARESAESVLDPVRRAARHARRFRDEVNPYAEAAGLEMMPRVPQVPYLPEVPPARTTTSGRVPKIKSIRTVNDVVSAPHAALNVPGEEGIDVKTVPEVERSLNPRDSHALKNFTDHGKASHADSHQVEINSRLRSATRKAGELAHIKDMTDARALDNSFTDYIHQNLPSSADARGLPREDRRGRNAQEEGIKTQAAKDMKAIGGTPEEVRGAYRDTGFGTDVKNLGPGTKKLADLWTGSGGSLTPEEEAHLSRFPKRGDTELSNSEIRKQGARSPERQQRHIDKHVSEITKEGGLLEHASKINTPAYEGLKPTYQKVHEALGGLAPESVKEGLGQAVNPKNLLTGAGSMFLGSAISEAIDPDGGDSDDPTHAMLHDAMVGGTSGALQTGLDAMISRGGAAALTGGELAMGGAAGVGGMALGMGASAATKAGLKAIGVGEEGQKVGGDVAGGAAGMGGVQAGIEYGPGAVSKVMSKLGNAAKSVTSPAAEAGEAAEGVEMAELGAGATEAAAATEGAEGLGLLASMGAGAETGAEYGALAAPETGGGSVAAAVVAGAALGLGGYFAGKLDDATGNVVSTAVSGAVKDVGQGIRDTASSAWEGVKSVF